MLYFFIVVLLKYTPTTPSRRFLTNMRLVNRFVCAQAIFKQSKLHNLNFLRRICKTRCSYQLKLKLRLLGGINLVGIFLLWRKFHWQEFIFLKSVFNQTTIIPSSDIMRPGVILQNSQFIRYNERNSFFNGKFYIPILIALTEIPLHTKICLVYNYLSTKWTFSRSLGCFSVRQKSHKKLKLYKVSLPSKKVYIFPYYTLCVFGRIPYKTPMKYTCGKFTSFFKKKQKISVRGVAMNPVDHPNGGRTKSNQPEKTPWGWIAKCGK